MDTTLLKERTTKSTAGGAGSNIRIALKRDLAIIPEPTYLNPAVVSADFVFKAGKTWIDIWVDDKKNQLVEEANDVRFNNGYTGSLSAFSPGDNLILRQFINEGLVTEECYVLIDSCRDKSTLLVGKGECSPVSMKINYDSGASSSDEKGFTLTFAIDQEGVACEYRGAGAKSAIYTVPANETTPDVSAGTATYLIQLGDAPYAITDLANIVPGSIVTLRWEVGVNQPTLPNGGHFQLTSDFTPIGGEAILVLQIVSGVAFTEITRTILTSGGIPL